MIEAIQTAIKLAKSSQTAKMVPTLVKKKDIKMKMQSVIFREYDIRGVYDVDYDLDFAEQLGRAFISYISKKHKLKTHVSH